MNTQTAQIIPFSAKDAIQVVDGKPVTTSLDVAEKFHKRHDTVLRAIRDLDCSTDFRLHNFAETVASRANPSGGKPIESIMYRMTRDGFVFLCMGFTGAEAAKWKEAYINAFNEMEKALAEPEHITPEQQNALQQIIKRIAAGDGKKTVALWSRFNNHFRLGSYKQLTGQRFAEAVTYLEGLTGEYLPRPDLPNALHQIPTREQLFQEIIEESLGNLRLMVSVNKHHAMKVQHVAPNEIVTTAAQIPDLIRMGSQVPDKVLPKIIQAVASRM